MADGLRKAHNDTCTVEIKTFVKLCVGCLFPLAFKTRQIKLRMVNLVFISWPWNLKIDIGVAYETSILLVLQ